MEITEEQIDNAINNCIWRQEVGDNYICRGNVTTCSHAIDKGKCDALKKLFRGEVKE